MENTRYESTFWDYTKNKINAEKMPVMQDRLDTWSNGYQLPQDNNQQYMAALKQKSILRTLATVINMKSGTYSRYSIPAQTIPAEVVLDGGKALTVAGEDLASFPMKEHDLAALSTYSSSFISDVNIAFPDHLIQSMAERFAMLENKVFTNGNGTTEPCGLLHETEGAAVGAESAELNFDALLDLYFSVDPEFRLTGTWMMNDKSAVALKKIKDQSGAPVWNLNSNMLLGLPVIINNEMPDAETGSSPVAFGDFSKYWIIQTRPVSVRRLTELYTTKDQVGFLAHEFLDARLINPQAIKHLKIKAAS